MASITGLNFRKTSSSPPIHSASFRLSAPRGPPLTGESSMWTPRDLNTA